MDVLQAWLLIGVPGLIVAAALFTGHDRVRALFGYAVLAAVVVVFLFVDGGTVWAALVGMLAAGKVATGRGSVEVESAPEEHELRDRLTEADRA